MIRALAVFAVLIAAGCGERGPSGANKDYDRPPVESKPSAR